MLFVNREKELDVLEKTLNAARKGFPQKVLIYGIRRVGKTKLIDTFIGNKIGFRVDCAAISHGSEFFRAVYSNLLQLKGYDISFELKELDSDLLRSYYPYFKSPLDDSLEMLKQAFDLIRKISREFEYLIIALDEFHGLVENISLYSMPESAELAREKILWTIRDELQRSSENILWILSTSAGFLVEEYSKADKAFLELLKKMKIPPLSKEHSMELTEKIFSKYDLQYDKSILEYIATLSGGVPAIIEKICFILIGKEKVTKDLVIKKVETALEQGRFDEFFYSYINFIVDYMRWSRPTLIKILRCIAEGYKRTKDISKFSKIKPSTLANILSDLRKKKIITRDNELTYPLFKQWLLARPLPPLGAPRKDLLMYSLGITLESFVREVFSKIDKKITLEDGDKYFFGTAKKITINPIKKSSGGGDLDLIAEEITGRIIIAEIKSGKISEKDIKKFVEKCKKISQNKLMLVITGRGALPSAIAESVRNNVIMLSLDGLNLIAKKVGMPKIRL